MRARLFILPVFLLVAGSLGASDLWIHIRVIENDHRPTSVEVNLPLRLVERLAPMLDDYQQRDAEIRLGHKELDVEELRGVWARVRSGEVVIEDDAILELRKGPHGEQLVVTERDSQNGTVVTLPADVIDALLSGPHGYLDLEAAVRTLARHGEGEIVSAQDDGTIVRIWLDRNPEPRD